MTAAASRAGSAAATSTGDLHRACSSIEATTDGEQGLPPALAPDRGVAGVCNGRGNLAERQPGAVRFAGAPLQRPQGRHSEAFFGPRAAAMFGAARRHI